MVLQSSSMDVDGVYSSLLQPFSEPVLTLYRLLNAPYPSRKSVMTIWYQVQGREASNLKDVSLDNIADLRKDIKSEEAYKCPASLLELYVKFPNSNQEDELDLKLLKKCGGFNNLFSQYKIDEENPVIVRLQSGMHSSNLYSPDHLTVLPFAHHALHFLSPSLHCSFNFALCFIA